MTARPEDRVRVQIAGTGQTGTIDPADRDRWFHPDDGVPRRLGPKEQIRLLPPERDKATSTDEEADR